MNIASGNGGIVNDPEQSLVKGSNVEVRLLFKATRKVERLLQAQTFQLSLVDEAKTVEGKRQKGGGLLVGSERRSGTGLIMIFREARQLAREVPVGSEVSLCGGDLLSEEHVVEP